MQRLKLHLGPFFRNEADAVGDGLVEEEPDGLMDADGAEILQSVLVAVAACAAAGSLTHLELELDDVMPSFRLASWAAALHRLRSLRLLVITAPLAVVAPLHSMTALQDLALRGAPLQLQPVAKLPACLTKLELAGGNREEWEDIQRLP